MVSYKILLAFAIISSLLVLSFSLDKSPSGNGEGFVKFSYSGSLGPENWGSLNSEFELCDKGAGQSPINIETNATVLNTTLGTLNRDYIACNATLVNNGFNIGLVFDSKTGSIAVDGKKYKLKHIRWHSPSEHTLDGERFPVEFHLVHESKEGNVSIVSILYQYGPADSFLQQLTGKLNKLAKVRCNEDEEARMSADVIHTRSMKLSVRKYYRYVGSLTTPPCTENIIWNILGQVRTLSKEQVDALRAPLSGDHQSNSRPLQSLNGRIVQVYDKVEHAKK